MEKDLKIAPMSAETVEAVARLESECFSRPWSLEALRSELQNPLAVFLAAELAGEVIGYAGMHCVLDEGYIANVAVAARHRREGVARALVESLIACGRDKGLRFLTLEVRPSNRAAISLYRGLGFLKAGLRRRFYTDPAEDALLLTKYL